MLNLLEACRRHPGEEVHLRFHRRGDLRRHRSAAHAGETSLPSPCRPTASTSGWGSSTCASTPTSTAWPTPCCATPTCTGRGRTPTGRPAWSRSSSAASCGARSPPSSPTRARRTAWCATTCSSRTWPGPTWPPPAAAAGETINIGTGVPTTTGALYRALADGFPGAPEPRRDKARPGRPAQEPAGRAAGGEAAGLEAAGSPERRACPHRRVFSEPLSSWKKRRTYAPCA